MQTIKGPIVLGKGREISGELLNSIKKLPFKANNFKCSQNQHIIDDILEPVEEPREEVKELEEIIEEDLEEEIEVIDEESEIVEPKEHKFSKKELEELSFKELKKIGKKFGTTDRSKKNLIKEILNLQN